MLYTDQKMVYRNLYNVVKNLAEHDRSFPAHMVLKVAHTQVAVTYWWRNHGPWSKSFWWQIGLPVAGSVRSVGWVPLSQTVEAYSTKCLTKVLGPLRELGSVVTRFHAPGVSSVIITSLEI